jgi:hypothetical protein
MIIRSEKKGNFTIIDNGAFTDSNLSWKAKGILAYLLTKPNNWELIVNDLLNHTTDGKTATYSGIDELVSQGYIVKHQIRDDFTKQVEGLEYHIFETKALNTGNLKLEKPYSENLNTGILKSGNQPLINTDNKQILNI